MNETARLSKTSITSFTNSRNNVGPITLPCGTPLKTDIGRESKLPKLTHWERLDKKSVIHASRLPVCPYAFSLINNLGETESKAFLKSKYTTLVQLRDCMLLC